MKPLMLALLLSGCAPTVQRQAVCVENDQCICRDDWTDCAIATVQERRPFCTRGGVVVKRDWDKPEITVRPQVFEDDRKSDWAK